MRRLIYIAFLILTLTSCTREKRNFEVKGSFKGAHPDIIYLSELTNKGVLPVDSVKISDNGKFKLKGYAAFPTFFLLKVNKSRGIHLVIEPGDKIKIFINSDYFDIDYIVEGSVESKRINKLIVEQNKSLQKITNLSNEFENIKEGTDFPGNKKRLDSIYFSVINEHKKFSTDFILENTCSFASLMALYQQLGMREPVFNIQNDFYLFNIVDSCISSLYPQSEAVKTLNNKVVETREYIKLKTGAIAPEIALKDTLNNVISLNSLKGKYVLLNFWASWCTQCNADVPALLKLYKAYKNKGFEIYQVSLDKTSESWKKGITDNQMPCLSVSDLKYWNSEAVKSYYIKKLPFYMLIDRDGKIIGKDYSLFELDVKLGVLFK